MSEKQIPTARIIDFNREREDYRFQPREDEGKTDFSREGMMEIEKRRILTARGLAPTTVNIILPRV